MFLTVNCFKLAVYVYLVEVSLKGDLKDRVMEKAVNSK